MNFNGLGLLVVNFNRFNFLDGLGLFVLRCFNMNRLLVVFNRLGFFLFSGFA